METLVLLESEQGNRFFRAEQIEETGDRVHLTLVPSAGDDPAFIRGLKQPQRASRIWLSFSDTGTSATVESVDRSNDAAGEPLDRRAGPR